MRDSQYVFFCLTLCFKFLSRHFGAHIIETFDLVLPLLGSSYKDYVRHFAAESFAYLVRKVRVADLSPLASHMLDAARVGDATVRTSVAFVWFETMKGVQGAFHSRAADVAAAFQSESLNAVGRDGDDDTPSAAALVLRDCMTLCAAHAAAGVATPVPLSLVLDEVVRTHWTPAQMNALLGALAAWTNSRHASRIPAPDAVWQRLDERFAAADHSCDDALAFVLVGLLRAHAESLPADLPLLTAMAGRSPRAAMSLVGALLVDTKPAAMARVTPVTVALVRAGLASGDEESVRRATLFLRDVVCSGEWSSTIVAQLFDTVESSTTATTQKKKHRRAGSTAAAPQVQSNQQAALPAVWIKALKGAAAAAGGDESDAASLVASSAFASAVLRCMLAVDSSLLVGDGSKALVALADALVFAESSFPTGAALLDTRRTVTGPQRTRRGLLVQVFAVLRRVHSAGGLNSPVAPLSLLDTPLATDAGVLEAVNADLSADAAVTLTDARMDALLKSALSYEAPLREAALRLLTRCDTPLRAVAEAALDMEGMPCTLDTYREKIIRLTRVEPLLSAATDGSASSEQIARLGIRLLISNLTINFRPLWSDFVRALAAQAALHTGVFWETFLAVLNEMRAAQFAGARDDSEFRSLVSVNDDESSEEDDRNNGLVPAAAKKENERPHQRRARLMFSIEDTSYRRFFEEMRARQRRYGDAARYLVSALGDEVDFADEPLDHHHVEIQLWRALESTPAVAERHTRHVLPFFYDYMQRVFELDEGGAHDEEAEKDDADAEAGDDEADENDAEAEDKSAATTSGSGVGPGRLVILNKALAMLAVIGKLRNPRAAYRADLLQGLLLRLLCNGDVRLQTASLEGLLAWRDSHVVPYEAALMTIVNDRHTRNEIAVLLSLLASAEEDAAAGVSEADEASRNTLSMRRMQQQQQQQRKAGKHGKELARGARDDRKDDHRDKEAFSFSATGLRRDDRSAVMSLVLRILFGKMHGRVAKASRWPLASRRSTIAAVLYSCNDDERALFFSLLLRPILVESAAAPLFAPPLYRPSSVDMLVPTLALGSGVPSAVQRGFLAVFDDVVRHTGARCIPVLPLLLSVLAHIALGRAYGPQDTPSEDRLRAMRQSGLRRLAAAVRACPSFDFEEALARVDIASGLVAPRLALFATEQTQSTAGLLEVLLAAAAERSTTLSLLVSGALPAETLPSVLAALSARNVSPVVFGGLLTLIESLLILVEAEQESADDEPEEQLIGPFVARAVVPAMLDHMVIVLRERLQNGGSGVKSTESASVTPLPGDAIPRMLSILAQVSRFAVDQHQAVQLVELLVPMIHVRRSVPERLKTSALRVMERLIPLLPLPVGQQVPPLMASLAPLLAVLADNECRVALCNVLVAVAKQTPRAAPVADCLLRMHAMESGRIESIDWDTRLAAFTDAESLIDNAVLGEPVETKTPAKRTKKAAEAAASPVALPVSFVTPLIHAGAFLLQEKEEFAMRAHAVMLLKKMVTRAASEAPGTVNGARSLAVAVILPAARRALSNPSENVRQDALTLLASCAEQLGATEKRFAPLVPLLLDGAADESSFVDTVYHIQLHRRARAWRRIATAIENGSVGVAAVQLVIEPLVPFVLIEGGGSAPASSLTTVSSTSNQKSQLGAHNVVDAALEAMTAAAGSMSWGAYLGFFKRTVGLVNRHPAREKTLVRAVVAVAAGFHFKDAAAVEPSAAVAQVAVPAPIPVADAAADDDDALDAVIEEEEEEEAQAAVAAAAAASVLSARIRHGVSAVVLPSLYRLMTEKAGSNAVAPTLLSLAGKSDAMREEAVVRVPVALAVVQLLKALPDSMMHKHLPSLLTALAQLLRARDEGSREVTRSTLVKVTTMLGPRYFNAILQELAAALQRGYQLHVLSYTVHALLAALVPSLKTGDDAEQAADQDEMQVETAPNANGADSVSPAAAPGAPLLDGAAIDTAAGIFVEELFGETAAEKEVHELASKSRETKMTKGHDGLELLARCVVAAQVPLLLESVCAVLMRAESVRLRMRAEEALRHIANGLALNRALADEDLLVLAHSLLTRTSELFGLADRFASSYKERARARAVRRDNEAPAETAADPAAAPDAKQDISRLPAPRAPTAAETFTVQFQGRPDAHWSDGTSKAVSNFAAHSPLLVEGGLFVLCSAIKRGRVHGQGSQQLALLDPFVSPLLESLSRRDAKLKQLALKALGLLLRLPLPSLDATQDRYVAVLVKIVTGGGPLALEDATVQAALKTLSLVLRHRESAALSDAQVARLLAVLQPSLSDAAHHTTVFSLLRSLVDRRRASAALYDAVDAVCHLMVRSELPTIRDAARSLVVAFLLDFPMGEKRMQAMLAHIVSQYEYEFSSGRESALLVTATLVDKLPDSVVRHYAHFVLLPLITVILNDDAPSCRQIATAAARGLVARMDGKLRDATLRLATEWAAAGAKLTLGVAGVREEQRVAATVRAGVQLLSVMLDASATSASAASAGVADGAGADKVLVGAVISSLESLRLHSDAEHLDDDAPWELVYSVEGLWSRLLRAAPSSTLRAVNGDVFFESLWAAMRHPHAWVRKAAARRLGHVLAAVDVSNLCLTAEKESEAPPSAKRARTDARSQAQWSLAPRLPRAVRACVGQLGGRHIDTEHGDQIVKNLYVLGRAAYAHPAEAEQEEDDEEDEEDADEHDDEDDEHEGAGDDEQAEEEEEDSDADSDAEAPSETEDAAKLAELKTVIMGSCASSAPFERLYRRLCAYARRESGRGTSTTQRALVFKWLAAVSQAVSKADLATLLPAALIPLLRTTQDTTSKYDGFEDLQRLSGEVQEMLKRAAGPDAYVAAHEKVTRFLALKRRERRRNAARVAIVNPEQAAARKLKRNMSKREQHKRKVAKFMSHKPAKGVLKARRIDQA